MSGNGGRAGTVAVLGATGGVGRQAWAAFRRRGHDVLPVARGTGRGLPGVICVDVAEADPRELGALLADRNVRVVVNAIGGWVSTEEEMRLAHVHLVDNLLRAVTELPWRPRIVQIGSIHEYGPVSVGTAVHEGVVPTPETAYARTKHAGAAAVLAATESGDVDGVVLRAVNVCGPRTTSASFLGATVAKLRAVHPRERISLTVADARRDYVDARDLAEAVLFAADRPVGGRVINIGRGEAVAMRDLVDMLLAAAGRGPDSVDVTDAHVDSKGAGWTQADVSLARELLGWRPRIPLRTSIQDMWEAETDLGEAL